MKRWKRARSRPVSPSNKITGSSMISSSPGVSFAPPAPEIFLGDKCPENGSVVPPPAPFFFRR